VSVFLACFYNACASDRFSARSCSLKRAYSRQPVSVVCYRPFIHSRHNAKDRTPKLKVGRDIVTVLAGRTLNKDGRPVLRVWRRDHAM